MTLAELIARRDGRSPEGAADPFQKIGFIAPHHRR